ncbi:MAG: A/G-specific adenine glycosylase [Dokdonella sp.]
MKPFAERLLAWFDVHGRHDLPWQHPRDPYRVWVSEVMLQQTQVRTVIAYFEQFVSELPDIESLAVASEDRVFGLWSGLGYYSRARNLRRAAQTVIAEHGGKLPTDIEALQTLPGIGPSTAAAILAQANGQRHAILDGNVKRVLARHRGIDGWPGGSKVQAALWNEAERFTPHDRIADYTQAIMDLGATICIRSRPRCSECPVAADCVARLENRTTELPQRKPRRAIPARATTMLLLRDADGRVLLQKRPPTGVWSGLWSLPEFADRVAADNALQDYGATYSKELDAFTHTFSHFRLEIAPLLADVVVPFRAVADAPDLEWYGSEQWSVLGLPAPVRRLLQSLDTQQTGTRDVP